MTNSGAIAASGAANETPPALLSKFKTGTYTGNNAVRDIVTGFPAGLVVIFNTAGNSSGPTWVGFDEVNGPFFWGDPANEQSRTFGQGETDDSLTSFNFNGFSLGADITGICNATGVAYRYFVWAESPGFFNITQYSGDHTNNKIINHGLGGVPRLASIIGGNPTPGANGTALCFASDNMAAGNAFQHIIYFPGNAAIIDSVDYSMWPTLYNTPGALFDNQQIVVGRNSLTNAMGTFYTMYTWGVGPPGSPSAAFGTYTGNGSTSGPSVSNMGFTPSMVIILKQLDNTASNNMRWVYGNTASGSLNLDAAASSTNFIDLVSGGFNVKTANGDFNTTGKIYAYYAWK